MSIDDKLRRYSPGDRIITEGERGDTVFILRRGELAIWRGAVELARTSAPGDMIGEMAALSGRARSATVVAVTEAELLVLHLDPRKIAFRHPEVLEKIDFEISQRFELVRNKASLYVSETAQARRALLQNVMVEKEKAFRPNMKENESQLRKKMRKTLEEALELRGDPDNPRVLRQIADQNGVLDRYNEGLERNPWLSEALVERFREIIDRFTLSTRIDLVSALRERAGLAAELLDLLGEFESLPGIRRQMDIQKLEKVVPFAARMDALRRVGMKKLMEGQSELSERERNYFERRLLTLVDSEKSNSGTDSVMLIRVAEQLAVMEDYESDLRALVSASDMDSSFVEPVS